MKNYSGLMKKGAFLALILLAGLKNVTAQVDFTFGTGTAGNTSTTYPCPLQDRFEGSRAQYLFLASELIASGMVAGNISAIKFNVISIASFSGSIEQLTVRMGGTTTGSLAGNSWEPVQPAVLYGPINFVPVVGLNTLQFATPFNWNGTDNIVVEICNGDINNAATGVSTQSNNPVVSWTTGLAFNASHTYRADNIGYGCGTNETTNTGTQSTRPNIVFSLAPASVCSGMPVAGTASSTISSACIGVPFTLSVTGSTFQSGINYQWEKSNDGANFSPIPGANQFSYTGTQAGSTFYRFKATCAPVNLSAVSNTVSISSPLVMGGSNYSINRAVTNPAQLYPNTQVFNSFNSAYNALKCGIIAPVVFTVAANSGPYDEQLICTGTIPGTSATNTITFNGNGNTIGYNTGSVEKAVIKLNNVSHFIFEDLVINPTGSANGFGIQLLNNSDSNIVKNCTINISTTINTTSFAGIVISGVDNNPIATGATLCDYNKFLHNKITGGYYGITITATANNTGACFFNEFVGNNVADFYAYGIYVTGNNGLTIDSNYFSRPNRTAVFAFNGIYFAGNSERCQVTRNRIFNPFGGSVASTQDFNGINFSSASAQSGTENFVTNNLIYNVNGNGVVNGIQNSASAFVYYLHNTIALDNAASTSTASTRGFNQSSVATGVQLYNNIISITRGGTGAKYCIYAGNTTSLISDYNNLYVSAPGTNNFIGYFNGNRVDLAAWKSASGLDAGSFSYVPLFTNPGAGNYTPTQAALDGRAYPVGIPVDIENKQRSAISPDPGAYEFVAPACTTPPLAGNASVLPSDVCNGSYVSLMLKNNSWGFGMVFQWQYSATANGTFINFGAARSLPDTGFSATEKGYFRMAIRCGAVTSYSDTVFLNVHALFASGSYSINQNAPASYVEGLPGGNFTSFNEALAAMDCGLDGLGDVVMNVAGNSGTYFEQLIIDSLVGTSANSKLIFRGNGNTLSFSSNNANEKAVIKISRSSYIVFDSLTIDANGGGTQGFAVHLINNADNNEFRNCTMLTSTTALNPNYAGIVINGSASAGVSAQPGYCDNNLFINNLISGGYYSVVANGSPTGTGRIEDNRFMQNSLEDFYIYGFYLGEGNYRTLLEKNRISRPARTNPGTANAIYLTGLGSSVTVSKNRIFNLFGGAPASSASSYGIYINNANAVAGMPHVIVNNLIYNLNGHGQVIGIQNTRSAFTDIIHNTVVIDNQEPTNAATARGFYQTGDAANIRFLNNILSLTKSGTGAKHALYFETATSSIESNNNDCYVAGGGTSNFFGYYNGNRAGLTDWQTASGKDSKSFEYNPLFTNPAANNYRPTHSGIDNIGAPLGVTTDINDLVRHSTTPDVGAIEFSVTNCVAPAATTATVFPNTNICVDVPLTLDIPGTIPYNGLKFIWESGVSATGPWVAITDSLDLPLTIVKARATAFYRAKIICSGTISYSSVANVGLSLLLNGGSYTINSSQPTNYTGTPGANFHSFTDAVAYMQCGITGPIVFNVQPGINGVYNEQVTIGSIPGSSVANRITFQAANGSASSVNIMYESRRSDSNWVVKLNSASNISFKNLTITSLAAGYGRAFEFGPDCSNDSLANCHIVGPATNTTAASMTVVFSGQAKGTGNVILGNAIENGSSGIQYAGTAVNNLQASPFLVEGNTVSNSFSHSILLQNLSKAVVKGNTVKLSSPLQTGSAGIYLAFSDTSSFRLLNNTVKIDSVAGGISNGIYINNTKPLQGDSSIMSANRVEAVKNNGGSVFGITLANAQGIQFVNNVIAINSAGPSAIGLYTVGSNDHLNILNNSVSVRAASANNYAGYFFTSALNTRIRIHNNIFSCFGNGVSVYVNNTGSFSSDYNLLYTTGPVLTHLAAGASNTPFANLPAWKAGSNWDKNSISIKPEFADTITLSPLVSNANAWAMQGRGLQVRGNTFDYNGNRRADLLTAGVPDLGAYEFFPSVAPPVLQAIPATPAIGQYQTFMFGTDTVMKLKWNNQLPQSIEVRRYSGVVPTGLGTRPDSMFFYTQVNVPNSTDISYDAELFYFDSWQGSIESQSRLGLGRTTPGNAWVVGFTSKVSTSQKIISQQAMNYLGRFTGLYNPSAITGDNADSASNAGKNFWVGYQRTNGFDGNEQDMVLYFGAGDKEASVRVEIAGTSYVRNYIVPPYTAISSELIPKSGSEDARMISEGLLNRGIHITSDVPIVAYAHIYEMANSGATMLMPVGVWGYEYFTLNSWQNYSSLSSSVFHVIAQQDSTWVEVTPSKNSRGGLTGGQTYLVKLNKGETYQVLGSPTTGSQGEDLTGSIIRSVPNNQGVCHSIAVFAGSTRTSIDCYDNDGASSGDLIIQQVFPSQAWGTSYLLASTSLSSGPNAGSSMLNKYRVLVKDTATEVRRNGNLLPKATLINQRYYEFETQTPDVVEASKPVMVAQYMVSSGTCTNTGGDGDPEMFYLSPLQQAIRQTFFYRNITYRINTNFLTMVVPTEGLETLKIDGLPIANYLPTEIFTYPHSAPGYSVVTKKWGRTAGASSVSCEKPFTGIVYGMGSVESYGYNVGTLVKNLTSGSSIQNQYNASNQPVEYTCEGTPFYAKALLNLHPDSILWHFSALPGLTPSADSISKAPKAIDTTIINGITFYSFRVNQPLIMSKPGVYTIPFDYWHSSIEGCDKKRSGNIYLQVLPKHQTDFSILLSGGGLEACEGETATFTGDQISQNGLTLTNWNWTINNGTSNPINVSGRVQADIPFNIAGTYDVIMNSITADGCVSDTTKKVIVNPKPVVATVPVVVVCPGEQAILTVSNPVQGVKYYWFTVPTGGTAIDSGTTITVTNPPIGASYYAEAWSNSCISSTRSRTTIDQLAKLATPTVTVTDITVSEIGFQWTAVPGATGYELVVSINGAPGAPLIVQAATLTYKVTNLQPATTVSLSVKAITGRDCQKSDAGTASAATRIDQIFIPNAFTPNGDGNNDKLYVYSYVISKMQMSIFNQWGEKVFESSNMVCTSNSSCPGTGWDGKQKGKNAPMGVYMYVARFTLSDGTVVERKGSINLVR